MELAENRGALIWYPVDAVGLDFPDVPEHIAAAATEATACQSVDHHRAAVLLARSVIEATAKDKCITTGNLVAKIDEMKTQGLIRAHITEAAHEIRFLGNEMAHGDFATVVGAEGAEDTLALMGEVLNEVYQSPARVQKRRDARLAANTAAASPSTP